MNFNMAGAYPYPLTGLGSELEVCRFQKFLGTPEWTFLGAAQVKFFNCFCMENNNPYVAKPTRN